jgi:hypothetical protein
MPGVGVTLVALSLSHLAHGIELVTGAPAWEAWAGVSWSKTMFIMLWRVLMFPTTSFCRAMHHCRIASLPLAFVAKSKTASVVNRFDQLTQSFAS